MSAKTETAGYGTDTVTLTTADQAYEVRFPPGTVKVVVTGDNIFYWALDGTHEADLSDDKHYMAADTTGQVPLPKVDPSSNPYVQRLFFQSAVNGAKVTYSWYNR